MRYNRTLKENKLLWHQSHRIRPITPKSQHPDKRTLKENKLLWLQSHRIRPVTPKTNTLTSVRWKRRNWKLCRQTIVKHKTSPRVSPSHRDNAWNVPAARLECQLQGEEVIACIQQQHSKAGYSLVHLELLGLPPRAARAKFPWKTTWVNFLTPIAWTVNTCARAASYIHTYTHVQLYIHTCMYNSKVSK